MNRIAVIGASGMLGLPVARSLARAGLQVTALTRDIERARQKLGPGIEAVAADVRDVDALARALHGHDGLHLNLSVDHVGGDAVFQTEREGLDNIIAAARDAGVRRISYVSALVQDSPSDWWVLRIWRDAIATLKSCEIPSTIFYPTNFMETLPQRHMAGPLQLLPGEARERNWWISADDFGAQVAASFRLPGDDNREYVVQGPEPMTYEEAARRFADAAPGRIVIMKLPLPLLQALGPLSPTIRFNFELMRTVLAYPETFRAEATWRELGAPRTTIEDFAAGR